MEGARLSGHASAGARAKQLQGGERAYRPQIYRDLQSTTTILTHAMSTASKLTLAGTTLGALGIVLGVHFQQKAEQAVRSASTRSNMTSLTSRQAMHAGVIRDLEQQRLKRERQLDFDMQQKLEEEYRKLQTVSDNKPSG